MLNNMKKNKLTSLIIDDDLFYSEILKNQLLQLIDDVEISHNAENGSYYVSTQKPDFIFLDHQLPKLNGLEVVSLYKEVSPNSTLILASSFFNSLEEIDKLLRDKVDYVINKEDITIERLRTVLNVDVPKAEVKKSDLLQDITGWITSEKSLKGKFST